MPETTPLTLTTREKAQLLLWAREALRAHLTDAPAPSISQDDLTDGLRSPAACFVTLTKAGVLRGCILDSFVPHEPVYKNVMRNVVLAATVDTRFPPVTLDELDALRIEVSVLEPPSPLTEISPESLLTTLRPGIDGVILTSTYGSATFLPQVWAQLPDPETFLAELCRKHGAPGDCWRTDDLLRVERYQVDHFEEEDPISPSDHD